MLIDTFTQAFNVWVPVTLSLALIGLGFTLGRLQRGE